MSHHYSGPDFRFPQGDARLDFTDLYAFPKPGDASKSILIMNVHPSAGENPPRPTTTEPFAPEALYELKIDTDGDAMADIAYRVRFSAFERGAQTGILRRVDGSEAAGTGDGGRVIVDRARVSIGREARVTQAGDIRFFAGWRSDPFFCDVEGAKNNLQFTGDDFFADKDVCSIVLEVPNSALGAKEVRLWARTLTPGDGGGWIQVQRGARPAQANGFGTTGDMWGHLASALIEDHMIVALDLRGLGLSSKPDGGYDKKNQAADVVGVLDALGVRTAELVTHDIGIMVGFAVAATHPERVSRWVAIDAPLPGVGPWDQIRQDPAMWHFGFGGHDMERLVAGRERIYLDRFWNELSRDQKRFDEAKRQHYAALYARPGAMRAGFAQFLAFSQDATDNRTFLAQGKLQMPVLALGGEATFGPMMGTVMRCVANNVEDVIIPHCGHWITEEQPAATTKLVVHFLHRR